MRAITSTLLLLLTLSACQRPPSAPEARSPSRDSLPNATSDAPESAPVKQTASPHHGTALAAEPQEGEAVATFAGGCFWCMEGPFERIEGVRAVLSGYTDGPERGPTYEQVSSGRTGHTEAVRIYYDPAQVSYEALLDAYWRSMDPTDAGGQFGDRGSQYRPGIFVHDDTQRQAAQASKEALGRSGRFDKPIIVPIQDAGDFWVAEDYHQDYYKTNAAHYARYRVGSGRAGFLTRVWGTQ